MLTATRGKSWPLPLSYSPCPNFFHLTPTKLISYFITSFCFKIKGNHRLGNNCLFLSLLMTTMIVKVNKQNMKHFSQRHLRSRVQRKSQGLQILLMTGVSVTSAS